MTTDDEDVDVDLDGLVFNGVAMVAFVQDVVVVVEVTGFRRFLIFDTLIGDEAFTISFERADDLTISLVSSVSNTKKKQQKINKFHKK